MSLEVITVSLRTNWLRKTACIRNGLPEVFIKLIFVKSFAKSLWKYPRWSHFLAQLRPPGVSFPKNWESCSELFFSRKTERFILYYGTVINETLFLHIAKVHKSFYNLRTTLAIIILFNLRCKFSWFLNFYKNVLDF